MKVKEFLKQCWHELGRDHRHDYGYEHALDDLWDALDPHNPCHDEVRHWITERRKLFKL